MSDEETVSVFELPGMVGAYIISAPLQFCRNNQGQMILLNPQDVVRVGDLDLVEIKEQK